MTALERLGDDTRPESRRHLQIDESRFGGIDFCDAGQARDALLRDGHGDIHRVFAPHLAGRQRDRGGEVAVRRVTSGAQVYGRRGRLVNTERVGGGGDTRAQSVFYCCENG